MKKRRSLIILAIFILLLLLLGLWLSSRKPSQTDGGGTAAVMKQETTLAFLPSVDADEATLNVMKAAAAQLFEDLQAADSQVNLLYWQSGTPPKGASCAVSALSGADELRAALEQARTGGNLTTAFQFATDLSEASGNPYRTLMLLTDRAPADGAESDEGPYDSLDTAAFRYANAAADAAAKLSLRDSLSVTVFLQGLSGQDFDFTRRFFNDIQTAGYYEILNGSELDAVRAKIASELLTDSGVQKLTFRYPRGHDYSAVCYYSDDYFADSAYTYNPSLATMSVSLALSAFASEDQTRYANKSANPGKRH